MKNQSCLKRIISISLALCLLLATLSTIVFAEDALFDSTSATMEPNKLNSDSYTVTLYFIDQPGRDLIPQET